MKQIQELSMVFCNFLNKKIYFKILSLVFVITIAISCSNSNFKMDGFGDLESGTLTGLLPLLLASSTPTFKVHKITNFALDGNAAEFIASESITDNNNTVLATDPTGDETAEAGTDIKKVYMAHDGTNFIFFFQTSGLPPDSGAQGSAGRFYQIDISGWAAGVSSNTGVAGRFAANDFFNANGLCMTNSTADAQLVNNLPAGVFGFEFRASPSCFATGTVGSLVTTKQSNSRVDVTGDFNSIYWDQVPIEKKNVTWDFANY